MPYKNKEDSRARTRRDYLKNKEAYHRRSNEGKRKMRANNRLLIIEAKKKPCMDCGNSYPPYVMDFDHRPYEDKDCEISKMAMNKGSVAVLREIEKCDLVCANCHRERTYLRGKTQGVK